MNNQALVFAVLFPVGEAVLLLDSWEAFFLLGIGLVPLFYCRCSHKHMHPHTGETNTEG